MKKTDKELGLNPDRYSWFEKSMETMVLADPEGNAKKVKNLICASDCGRQFYDFKEGKLIPINFLEAIEQDSYQYREWEQHGCWRCVGAPTLRDEETGQIRKGVFVFQPFADEEEKLLKSVL